MANQRHENCAIPGCQVCYEDALSLERELRGKVGFRDGSLERYRKWLDAVGIDAETNGWPSAAAYDSDTIRRYQEFLQ